jgi:hypothetical protein
MKARQLLIIIFAALLAGCQTMSTKYSSTHLPVNLGVEVLFTKHLNLIRG